MSIFDKYDFSGFIGKYLVYIYDNGWNYEIYVKNGYIFDYCIYSGIVGNCWVKDQEVYIVWVGESIYKIFWIELIGIDVSLIVNLGDKLFYGIIFFLCWIMNNLEKIICFQNDYILLMNLYCDVGLVYLMEVIDEFVIIIFICDCGVDNDEVINCLVSELFVDFFVNL